MRREKGTVKKLIAAWILIISMILPVLCFETLSYAFDSSQAMLYRDYSRTHNVENGVLFIGTYLINLNGISDTIYDKAMDSASDSGQDTIYYKSELAGGCWFSLGDANSINDITEKGVPVDDDEINSLYVKYYVDAKGILKDVMGDVEKNPFDLIDPYDLRNLPELESLKTQFTYSKEVSDITLEGFLNNRSSADKGTLRADVYYYRIISVFFSLNTRDAETNRLDSQLNRLYECYKSYKAAGNGDEADIVYDLMEKVDAARRLIVFEKLSQLDQNALGELYDMANGSCFTAKGDFKVGSTAGYPDWLIPLRECLETDFGSTSKSDRSDRDDKNYWTWWIPLVPDEPEDDDEDEEQEEEKVPLAVDSAIIDAISSGLENCQNSYSDNLSKALMDSDGIIEHAMYEYATKVIENATPSGLSSDTVNYKHITNIKEGIVKDQEGELDLLNTVLLPRAEKAYSDKLKGGASGEYAAALASGKAGSVLENTLDLQKLTVETGRNDLQFVISARHKRMAAADSLTDCYSKIDLADSWKKTVKNDAFYSRARQSADDYIIWLKQEANKCKNEDDSLASDLDKLKDKKEELIKKKQACLDDNDLAGAKDYDAMIAAVDQDISDEIDKLANELEETDSAGKKAEILNNLGNSGAGLTDKLKDKAKSSINDGNLDGLDNLIDALAGLGDLDGLKEIAELLEDSDASASLLNDLNDAIDALSADDGSGSGEGEGEGSGSGLGGITEKDLTDALKDMFGDQSKWSDETLAAVITALSSLGDEGVIPAGRLAKDYADTALANKNDYIFKKYSGNSTGEYLMIKTLALVTPYRYVFDVSRMEAVVTKGKTVYTFTVGHEKGLLGSESIDLVSPGVYDQGFYLNEADTMTYFKCDAQYINGRDYAVCITEKVREKADAFIALFE